MKIVYVVLCLIVCIGCSTLQTDDILMGDKVRLFTAHNVPCIVGDKGNYFAPQFDDGQWAVIKEYFLTTNISVNVDCTKGRWESIKASK